MDDKADLVELLKSLVSGEIQKRIEANTAILAFGNEAVEPLIKLLANTDNFDSWWLIADSLGAIGDKRAVEPLIAMLKSPLSHEAILARKYAAWALGALKDLRAVDVLLEIFNDRLYEEDEDGTVLEDEPDQETIEAAIYALTEIGDLRALEPIIQRISDDCYIQGETLTPWGEPALRLLIETLESEDENRRRSAASLLGAFGDSEAVPALIEAVQKDKSDRVRCSATYALGLDLLRDPRACDALKVALNDPHELTRMYAEWGLDRLREMGVCD